MGRPHSSGKLRWPCWLGVLLMAGCSATPGNSLILFPQGHRLLESAKAIRPPTPLALPRELDKRVMATYIVEPGDVLLVQPADLDSPIHLPADQTVMPDGSISLGRYGHTIVAGRTLEEIESLVHTWIANQPKGKDVGPITARVVTRISKVYYVLGEVNAPGSFPLQGRETVLDGILAAGGLTDRASRKDIILSRPTLPNHCRVVLPICYREIVQLGDTSTNYQLRPGDRIYVATRSCWDGLCSRNKDCATCGRPQSGCPALPLSEHADPNLPGGNLSGGPWLGTGIKYQPSEPTVNPPLEKLTLPDAK